LTPLLGTAGIYFYRGLRYIGGGYVGDLDFTEWRLKRARRVLEEYIRGVKKRASDINWVMGVLKGNVGVSKKEALELLEQVSNDKTLLITPERFKRLEILRKRVEAEEW
jgi:hypothetical protein